MLGLDRATLRKLTSSRMFEGVRLKSSLCEIFHENTKLTPLSGRTAGALSAAFLRSKAAHKLTEAPYKQYSLMDREALPEIEPQGEFEEILVGRRSRRVFSGDPATREELAKLLYLTYGRTAPGGLFRPVASGGGLYPLELYITVINVEGLEPGLYHYNIEHHCLDALQRGKPDFEELGELLWLQDIEDPEQATMIVYVTAILQRSTLKYGDRGYRLVLLEAGEVIQNLALVGHSMGLGSLPLGGFMDNPLSEYLRIDGVDEVPLVPMVFGRPPQAASSVSKTDAETGD